MSEEPLVHVDVEYCPTCGVPLCYCKFFNLHPTEAQPASSEAAPNTQSAAKTAKADGGEEAEEQTEKPAPQAKKAKGGKPEAAKPKIVVTVKSRSKRKNITSVSSLEHWDINLKELSKEVAKQMAIGCSIKKKGAENQLVIQGDAASNVVSLLKTKYNVPANMITTARKQKKPAEGEEGGEDSDDSDD